MLEQDALRVADSTIMPHRIHSAIADALDLVRKVALVGISRVWTDQREAKSGIEVVFKTYISVWVRFLQEHG